MANKRILITSALPYVNNTPHIGNIIGCVLSADCYNRYMKLKGYNTFFVCGTDEYGTPIETKARLEKLDCKAICDSYHEIHRSVYDWLSIEFSAFGRTTDDSHRRTVERIFHDLYNKNCFREETRDVLYCEKCAIYLSDRFVEGVCPQCSYADCRGDQCDACGGIIDALKLVSPRCKFCTSTPVVRQSTNLYLKISEINQETVVQNLESHSENARRIVESWLTNTITDRCITRDMSWGIPVPLESYKGKVFYVWFDAVLGYISMCEKHGIDWWTEKTEFVQFMGKDNVFFHSVLFMYILERLGYTCKQTISATEYLNYDSQKFSKSRGIGIFGTELMKSTLPCDAWRFYLLSVRPETKDTDFQLSGLITANNVDLVNNIGNLVSRVMRYVEKFYNSVVPAATLDNELSSELSRIEESYHKSMSSIMFRPAVSALLEYSSTINRYLQTQKLSQELFEKERERANMVAYSALYFIYKMSILLEPFCPNAARSIRRMLSLEEIDREDIPAGHKINTFETLFQKIKDESTLFKK